MIAWTEELDAQLFDLAIRWAREDQRKPLHHVYCTLTGDTERTVGAIKARLQKLKDNPCVIEDEKDLLEKAYLHVSRNSKRTAYLRCAFVYKHPKRDPEWLIKISRKRLRGYLNRNPQLHTFEDIQNALCIPDEDLPLLEVMVKDLNITYKHKKSTQECSTIEDIDDDVQAVLRDAACATYTKETQIRAMRILALTCQHAEVDWEILTIESVNSSVDQSGTCRFCGSTVCRTWNASLQESKLSII